MTHRDRTSGHPLTGVPEEVLLRAHEALGAWEETDAWDDSVIREVAAALVANLNSSGFITWPGRARIPDRETLVLAVMSAQAWQSSEDGRSVAEYLVDTVVLPLLLGVAGPTSRDAHRSIVNQVTGDVTGSVIQADRIGEVRL